jgi:uncharacterized protein (TIGR02001 family)
MFNVGYWLRDRVCLWILRAQTISVGKPIMNALQRLAGGAATAVALFALAAPAFAGGSLKDKPAEPRRCTFSANAALTTDYVFRGFSQTAEGAAIQGGFDATCGMFYAGVWASSLDTDGLAGMELDLYAGVKGTVGKISYDLGVIYYAYPNNSTKFYGQPDMNYVELKAGVSTEVWKGGTLGATVFYSPDYTFETGNVWTLEGSFSQVIPYQIMGRITPTFSALYGFQKGEDNVYKTFKVANGDDSYSYWNAGVTFALDKNWSVDVRYWDTNISNSGGFCSKGSDFTGGKLIYQCDERVVGTLKFTY